MDRVAAIEHCLAKPGAYLDNPWGEEDSVVKVGGKIFAFLGQDGTPLSLALKNTEERIDEWRSRYPEHATVPRYLKKTLWNSIRTTGDGAPEDDDVRELIDDSYALIVASLPKSKRPG